MSALLTSFSAQVNHNIFFLVFILYMIRREMLHFVHMRHRFLISKSHSHLPQVRKSLGDREKFELFSPETLSTGSHCFNNISPRRTRKRERLAYVRQLRPRRYR